MSSTKSPSIASITHLNIPPIPAEESAVGFMPRRNARRSSAASPDPISPVSPGTTTSHTPTESESVAITTSQEHALQDSSPILEWNNDFHLISAPAIVRAGEEFEIVLGTENDFESDPDVDASYLAVLCMPVEKKIASAFQEIIVKVDKCTFTFTGTFDPEFDYYGGLTELKFHLLIDCDSQQTMVDELSVRMKIKPEE